MNITVAQKLEELRRERDLRKRVYRQFIALGKLKAADAAWRMEVLESIIRDYERVAKGGVQEGLTL